MAVTHGSVLTKQKSFFMVVTDLVIGTYQTVLTIDQSVPDIFGTYSCTVENIRGTSSAVYGLVACYGQF